MAQYLAKALAVVVLLNLSSAALALGRADVVCPASFDPSAAPPTGWKRHDPQAGDGGLTNLEGVAIYTTSPADGFAPLKPENAPATSTSDTWYIARGPHSAGPMLYVACRYSGTASMLFQALPPGLNECVAKRKIEPGQGLKVACNSRR
ncbi:hypothetical protein GCM10025771_12290 [Niveibacterium umoris]|uniref:Uncharacterized protein n=1 Tax=Niveibacterium umoris TaxID=1193620 RepID=A0A840BQY2_9RHOO|nr:STY0301 family protein [Niveibacterium umoris]MBB4013216.1 hypothetical protein [Niveibacterium umoris]